MREECTQGEQLRQDVALLMAWTKEQEDGTTVMLLERLEKLETRMVEKDQEIGELRDKVHLSSCRDWLRLMISDRRATVVRLVWRCRRKGSLNRYFLFNFVIYTKLIKSSRTKGSRISMLMTMFRFVVLFTVLW